MESGIEWITGIWLLLFGLSFTLNPGYWGPAVNNLVKDTGQTFTLFTVMLIFGLLIIRGHNLWVGDWRVLVTIVGWAVVLKTTAFLLAPRLITQYERWSDRTLTTWIRVGGILWSLGGGWIVFMTWQSAG